MTYNLPNSVSCSIFRANDIRGKVDLELTTDVVYAIGRAFSAELSKLGQDCVVVARDGRLSSPSLSSALIQGLRDSGISVIDIGAAPTPLMYFATHTLKASSGIMITGSHNPVDENGLKLILDKKVLSSKQISGLVETIRNRNFPVGGGSLAYVDLYSDYAEALAHCVRLSRKLKIVVDCGNGIVGNWFPSLAREIGCDVIESCCEVDGRFPNHFPDPSVAKNLQPLQEKVLECGADVGVAFDGDGDRLGMVTNTGRIIWPDRQLMLFVQDILKAMPGAPIIYDVKCTYLLDQWTREQGGKPIMWKTGHSLIKSKMSEIRAPLAGEMSGHFYFADRWYGFDDALYAAARLLEILSAANASAEEIFNAIPDTVNTPELRLPMADSKKFAFMDEFAKVSNFASGKLFSLDGVRVDWDHGFGLVRASNTSPYLILRFEANSETNLKEIQDQFRAKLLSIDAGLQMPF